MWLRVELLDYADILGHFFAVLQHFSTKQDTMRARAPRPTKTLRGYQDLNRRGEERYSYVGYSVEGMLSQQVSKVVVRMSFLCVFFFDVAILRNVNWECCCCRVWEGLLSQLAPVWALGDWEVGLRYVTGAQEHLYDVR